MANSICFKRFACGLAVSVCLTAISLVLMLGCLNDLLVRTKIRRTQNNSLMLRFFHGETAEIFDENSVTTSPRTLPPSLQKFAPRHVPFLAGYLQIPYAGFPGMSDVGEVRVTNNITDAERACDKLGVTCRAFTFALNASTSDTHAYFKHNLGIPTTVTSRHMYIKKEFVDLYLKGLHENLTCAVPLNQFQGRIHQGCTLPKLDPFDKDIIHMVSRLEPWKCNETHLYTTLENNTLRIRDGANLDNLDYVIVEPILRAKDSDYRFTLGPKKKLSRKNRSLRIQHDLWKVTSVLKNTNSITTYHLSVVEKPAVLQRRMSKGESPLDIIMISFDGISAAHFERMLPLTYKFLVHEMKTHFFKGYSVVGDATTPNVNAMLTGKTLEECAKIQEATRGKPNSGTVDKWPLIFKDLKDHGFSTMWSEDYASIGTYIYRLNGFRQQPTDHYGRPLWSGTGGMCIGGQFQVSLQLQYLKSFMESYPGRRKFGYTFLCDLTHDHLNGVSAADLELVTFLQTLKEENLFNNTMFMILSDHGWRFGKIRNTNQGRLEERLPLLSITLPPWFERQYPDEMEHFRRNKDIISSPFDLHATFRHLLSFPGNRETSRGNTRGISFFKPFPANRTCAEAGITDEWCPCLKWREIDPAHAHVKRGAIAAVQHLNKLLNENTLSARICHKIRLTKVLGAVQKMPSVEKILSDSECSYQIQFETIPGNARFEAHIRVDFSGAAYVYGSVSRINRYGSQPACIQSKIPALRKYCYCK